MVDHEERMYLLQCQLSRHDQLVGFLYLRLFVLWWCSQRYLKIYFSVVVVCHGLISLVIVSRYHHCTLITQTLMITVKQGVIDHLFFEGKCIQNINFSVDSYADFFACSCLQSIIFNNLKIFFAFFQIETEFLGRLDLT